MSRSEQIEKIVEWLKRHTDEEQAFYKVTHAPDDESAVQANIDGLRLFAAELLQASLQMENLSYIEDVEKQSEMKIAIPEQEWLKSGIIITQPAADNLEDFEEDEENDEGGSSGKTLERTFFIVGLMIVAALLFVLFVLLK